MKSYCKHLTIDEHMVREAFERWSTAAAGHKNLWRVEAEYGSADALIAEIVHEIQRRELTLRPIHRYRHREPSNGKIRIIGVESIKQQVVDYVAVLALEQLLTAKVGFYQVSSTRGKGQLFAAHTIRRWTQEGGYWVHLDVKQCYPSISHDVVMGILNRYVRSDDVLYICQVLLDTYGPGLDIGSYFSLRLSQLVLSLGYHHIEALAKVRRGTRHALVDHQIWYADDIVLISRDKRDLRKAVRSLERHMRDQLGLTLKPWKISRVGDDEPVDLAGFVVRPGRTTVRASIFLRARRAFRRFNRHPSLTRARSTCAYWGWITNSDSTTFIARNDITDIQKSARALVSTAARKGHHNGSDPHDLRDSA